MYSLKDELQVSPADCRQLLDLGAVATEHLAAPRDNFEHLLKQLPDTVQTGLQNLRDGHHESGFVIFRGVADPASLKLPPTPTARGHDPLPGHWTAGLLLLMAELLGSLIGYADEKDGRLIHDVHPVRGEEHRIENSGSVEFGYHTENVHHPFRPDHLGLLCLREDHERRAELRVASVQPTISMLAPRDIAALRQPGFYSLFPSSFSSGDRAARPRTTHAVLFGDPARPALRFNAHNTKATDERGHHALAALAEALRAAGREIAVRAGDLVVIDNHMALHGRSAFSPRYDGEDRWLRRFYALRALPEGLADRLPRPRVLPPLSARS